MTATFRQVRAADWPPELHQAVDRREAASSRVARARFQHELNAALDDYNAADHAVRRLMLALDKARRPEAYRK